MKPAVITATLLAILLPAYAIADTPAQSFSVAPAEVNIDNLLPGQTARFELTISNQGEQDQSFILTTFQPPEAARRAGRSALPDDSWISFSPQKIVVESGGAAGVGVTVAVPDGSEWSGRDWEIWLGVTAETGAVLAAQPCVRVLVSTAGPTESRSRIALIAVAVTGFVLLVYGACSLLRRRIP